MAQNRSLRIAVEGCCHGELDKIYDSISVLESKNNFKIDLLLICGDFQANRNETDLESMACPPKYREMNTYYKYYSGEKVAPVTTVFIGGNHEGAVHLSELFHVVTIILVFIILGRMGSAKYLLSWCCRSY